jgi:hypothetical protein
LTTPTKEEIFDRAYQLYYNEMREIANIPELDELKESGYYEKARIELMRGLSTRAGGVPDIASHTLPPDTKYYRSNHYLIKRKEVSNVNDWVEEWKKKDPYMLDIEGFEEYVTRKTMEMPVDVVITRGDTNYKGYYLSLELPYNAIPDQYKNLIDHDEEIRVQKLIDRLSEQLGKNIGFNRGDYSNHILVSDPPPIFDENGFRPGSTTIFR